MTKPKWTVATTRANPDNPTTREPSVVEIRIPVNHPIMRDLRVSVHRWMDAELDQWHVTCRDLGIERHEICARGASLQIAQLAALVVVHDVAGAVTAAITKLQLLKKRSA